MNDTSCGVVARQNPIENVEFAEGTVEEDLAVPLADVAVAEDEFAMAGCAADRVGVIRMEEDGVAGRNDAVSG